MSKCKSLDRRVESSVVILSNFNWWWTQRLLHKWWTLWEPASIQRCPSQVFFIFRFQALLCFEWYSNITSFWIEMAQKYLVFVVYFLYRFDHIFNVMFCLHLLHQTHCNFIKNIGVLISFISANLSILFLTLLRLNLFSFQKFRWVCLFSWSLSV